MGPSGDDRYRAGRRGRRHRFWWTNGDDHLRVPADHLTGEVGKALGPPLAGIALDGEVLPLDIAQPAQLRKKRLPRANSLVTDSGNGAGGDDNRDPVLPRRLLRLRR